MTRTKTALALTAAAILGGGVAHTIHEAGDEEVEARVLLPDGGASSPTSIEWVHVAALSPGVYASWQSPSGGGRAEVPNAPVSALLDWANQRLLARVPRARATFLNRSLRDGTLHVGYSVDREPRPPLAVPLLSLPSDARALVRAIDASATRIASGMKE